MPQRRLTNELRIVYELARVVGSGSYEVGDLLQRICSEIRTAFGFERALLVRMDEGARSVHAVVQQGVDWPGDDWLPVSLFPFLESAEEAGQAVLVRDANAEGAVPPEFVERFDVGSIAAAPLMVEGRCLGFIVGDRRDGSSSFELSDDELAFLTALGSIAAVFIDKADQYASLQIALAELRHLDELKVDFISVASHELRTPIAVVHGIASTLQHRGLDLPNEQVLELRATLYSQTARLRDLAEALLDLSRLDSGSMRLKLERFRARERIEDLLPRIAPEHVTEFEITVDPDFELKTDAHMFERIISNLIVNAVRYGAPPFVVASDRRNTWAKVLVEDRGQGVDPTFVPQLFDRFTRSDASRESQKDGAGLGLAIAHDFALSLGGELSYEPASPRGARFTLRLPT
jgi:signal transduction histidine kinase